MGFAWSRSAWRYSVGAALVVTASVALLMSALPVVQAQDRPPAAPGRAHADVDLRLEIVSGRADTITGGDALVRVHVPRTVPSHQVRVEVVDDSGTRDVTGAFAREDGARSLLGVVDGLAEDESTLRARTTGAGVGRPRHELPVTNHPSHGPVLSGPHQQPFFCDPTESGLSGDHDEHCHVADAVVEYFYRDAASGQFTPLADPATVPDGVADTTTTHGQQVPFIVRNERSTLNRGIYNIAVLHDPDQPAWGDPRQPQPQWN